MKITNLKPIEIKELDQKINKFIESLEFLWKNEPLDGDQTEEIAEAFLKELNQANGNTKEAV